MSDTLRRKAVALRRAAMFDCATDNYLVDPVVVRLLLELAAEFEAEADYVERDISTCRYDQRR